MILFSNKLLNVPLLFISMFFCSGILFAQEEESNEYAINKSKLERTISLQFAKVLTGTSFSNFGRYISVATDDKTFKLNGILLNTDNSVFTYELAGGLTNGIGAISNNGTLNNSVGGNVAFHQIINLFNKDGIPTNRIAIRNELSQDHQLKLEKLKLKSMSDQLDISHGKDLIDARNKQSALKKKYKKLRKRLSTESLSQNQLDSINYAVNRIEFDLLELKKTIETLSHEEYVLTSLEDRQQRFERDSVKLAEKNLDVVYSDLTWMSFGYGFKNDAYKLFDETQPLSDQIQKGSYTSQEINMALSRYRQGIPNKRDFFWSFVLKYELTSNLASLETRQIIDKDVIAATPIRESIRKQDVFIGELNKDISSLNIFFDYYRFFGSKGNLGFHIKPSFLILEEEKPFTALSFGLLIPFKKTKDQTAVVNAEIFYRINDFFNVGSVENSLLERNTIGVQVTFPISFITK